jgi:hypothetical protein
MVVGASALGHVIAIWQIFLSAIIFGIMTSLDSPARMALIPELVGTALIRQAITTNSVLANVGRALGPWRPRFWFPGTGWDGASSSTPRALCWW